MICVVLVNELFFVDILDYVWGFYLGRRYFCEYVDGGGIFWDGYILVYFIVVK